MSQALFLLAFFGAVLSPMLFFVATDAIRAHKQGVSFWEWKGAEQDD